MGHSLLCCSYLVSCLRAESVLDHVPEPLL